MAVSVDTRRRLYNSKGKQLYRDFYSGTWRNFRIDTGWLTPGA